MIIVLGGYYFKRIVYFDCEYKNMSLSQWLFKEINYEFVCLLLYNQVKLLVW